MLMLAALTSFAQGPRFTWINPATTEMKIKNFGANAIDISSYRLCSLFDYDPMVAGDVTLISGDFNLAPGEEVTFSWNTSGMAEAGADMGLYLPSGLFSSAAAMVDFVQWGSAGNGRENVANQAGLWVAGTFVTGGFPYEYTGDGTQNGVNFWQTEVIGGNSSIVINEVDTDTPGTDILEFIELYGEPNESLDGMVLVFINGSTDASYYSADLDGYSLNQEGFFVIGNAGVPNVGHIFNNNLLQNGPDAVALYYGDGADWPNGTMLSTDNIIDALVFDTDDVDDMGIMVLINAGQASANESGGGSPVSHSNSRVPDGGVQRNTDTYVQQVPTPGTFNQFQCIGAQIETQVDGLTSVTLCGGVDATIAVQTNSTAQATYFYVLVDENNTIVAISQESTVDLTTEVAGLYYIYGISFTGVLDPNTTEAGDPLNGITSSDCYSQSDNFITVNLLDCTCDGGEISASNNEETIIVCLDNDADLFSFSNTGAALDATYQYLVTDENNNILFFIEGDSYDFNDGEAAICRVWGISYNGVLDPASIAPGMPATAITTDGVCVVLSSNYITIVKQVCVVTDGCSDMFFSEYLEGSSFNKAIELYNPTDLILNLSEYEVRLYSNASLVPTNTEILTGTLAPGETLVLINDQASAAIQNQADLVSGATFFNGNDALELVHNGVVIDVIGIVGDDPAGEFWVVGDGGTNEHTLVRKVEITEGTTDWAIGATQWDVYNQDNVSFLGSHTAYPCSETPQVNMSNSGLFVNEGAGSVTFNVQAFNLTDGTTCTIALSSATAIAELDYSFVLPQDITFDDGNSDPVTFTVTILEDEEEESLENLVISLTCPVPEIEIVNPELTISILDNDQPIPLYPIIAVTGIDEAGVADSVGVLCELHGVVHGVNLRPEGLQFTLIDETDGIGVFSSDQNFGYTLVEGDSLHLIGTIEQFNGLTQIVLADLTYINSDNPLMAADFVTALNEATESQLVQLKCVELLDPSQWTNSGVGFNVDVNDGVNTYQLRIDADTDIFGTAPPAGRFSVIGIGGQFDADLPYDSGYQLIPRYLADFTESITADYTLSGDLVGDCLFGDEGVFGNTTWQAETDGAGNYSWEFSWVGGTYNTEGQEVDFSFDDNGIQNWSIFEMTVTLSVTDEDNLCTAISTITYCVDFPSNISENASAVSIYPNPSNGEVTLKSTEHIQSLELYSLDGRLLLSEQLNASNAQLQLGRFASGMYVLEFRFASGARSRQNLVIE
jgi:hypothetical protein